MIAPSDRRFFPRIAVTLVGRCRVGHRFLKNAVADLSLGGLFLNTRERAKEGTPVRMALALPLPEGPRICTLVGSVARVVLDHRGIPCGLGVSFEESQMTAEDLAALKGFLREREPELRSADSSM